MKIRNLLISSAALALTAGAASAGLIVDLVRQSGSGTVIVNPGDSFTLNIVATIDTTADGTGFQSTFGKIRTSGAAPANVTSALAIAPFDGSNHQDTDGPFSPTIFATLADLDGDLDIDVGSNTQTASAGWMYPRAGALTLGSSFVLGTVTFQIPLAATPGSTGTAIWERRVNGTGAGGALWREGAAVFTGVTTAAELYTNGAGVEYQVVPEPASLALAGVAGLGLLARRRRIAR